MIDTYHNDCILYWGRRIRIEQVAQNAERIDGLERKKTCVGRQEKRKSKIFFHYFPLIPRLQRMYMCSKLAAKMRWHKKE